MSQVQGIDPQNRSGEIIPPELAVKAMRDSGYKNTAYALAELIDNAVQANADNVEVVCVESYQKINDRARRRIAAIGVVDNGDGMSPDTLRLALQFGNGTHLTDRNGIGRFGMGLPNSSISQCRRVEVWTWQNGPDNAMYTYLDVNEIENRTMLAVPLPTHKELPDEWRVRSRIKTTGTLILWTNFEDHRLSWRGAQATLRNTETLVGRMYRKFIDTGRLTIRLLALQENEGEASIDEEVRVNDPLYLMANSSTPAPFNAEPMFQRWGEQDEEFPIDYDGVEHKVFVRMSWARQETVPEDRSDRGSKFYGKHAAKNIGLSIVREGRELDLDPSWANSYDPTERWWGVEVEFPSALDEVFGVTNTKQNATRFSAMAKFDWQVEAEPQESMQEFRTRIQDEEDLRALLLPIVDHIGNQIQEMRKRLKQQTIGRRTKEDRHDKPSVADLATTKFRERAEQGHSTDADQTEFTEEDRKNFEQDLKEDKHYPENIAKEIANATFKRKRTVEFLIKEMEGYAFFNTEHKHGGLTEVVFNTSHPFHEQLMEALEPNIDGESDADLVDRVHRAADTLKLLFAAWARYEMEEISQKERLFEIRQEWGKMARFFLTERDE